jgi:dTDP-4-amino-4,6-dideoxygalactose transaminase
LSLEGILGVKDAVVATQQQRINVTKTFMPPLEDYQAYLEKIWEAGHLTNQGPFLKELEAELQSYLKINKPHFVTNGTLALQVALRSLGVTSGEVITTPFTYVATISSILWERCKPVFVDIDPETLCIDAEKIEAAITKNTKAIMPVHVFGNPCDVEKIDAIAKRHNIKVIYDAAHAFGVEYNGKSLLSYGDISMCSLHSTKLFHTIEGGLLVANDKIVGDKIEHTKKFGHEGDNHIQLGINAKASEFQAAMGLCNLKYIEQIINDRKKIFKSYTKQLSDKLSRPIIRKGTNKYNYSYYPVLFKNEKKLLHAMEKLSKQNIHPRRYFYPSLNKLKYIKNTLQCPISENIASRVMCLPLYSGLDELNINRICETINS